MRMHRALKEVGMAVPKRKETRVGWLAANVMDILAAKNNIERMLHYVSNQPTNLPMFSYFRMGWRVKDYCTVSEQDLAHVPSRISGQARVPSCTCF